MGRGLGGERSRDEQLTGEVQSKPRGPLSRPAVQADVERIIEVYHRAGRYDVRAEPKVIELPNNRVDLVFEVVEGQRTTVREIRFLGNRAFGKSIACAVPVRAAALQGRRNRGDVRRPSACT